RRLASFAPRLLAPTVALLEGDDPAKALTVLRSAGYLPVAEAGGVAIANATPRVAAPAPLKPAMVGASGPRWADLAPTEAESLAEALLQGPVRPATALAPGSAGQQGREQACTNPDDIRRLLEWAADEMLLVEVGYVAPKGRTLRREVEPYQVSSNRLYAACPITNAEVSIRLDRVLSVRVTGAAQSEELDDDLEEDAPEPRIVILHPTPR
ncbi:MAG: hypothetical protein ACRDJU_03780, partial [Actinomycetota bacterium]